MQEHHLKITRTARYYTIGEKNQHTECIWLACHGYGQLASEFISGFEPLLDGKHLVVAPEALSRFYLRGFTGQVGATWMTKEDREHEIGDYVSYLETLLENVCGASDVNEMKINALGFSQGTATICRWFVKTKYKIENLILCAGAIPPELTAESALSSFKTSRLVYVLGDSDPYYEAKALKAELFRLKKSGLQPEVLRFKGGHIIDAEMLAKLAGF